MFLLNRITTNVNRIMKRFILPLVVMTFLIGCKTEKDQNRDISLTYPETKKVDTVDTYFGTEVPDPYRWLEDDRSAETEEWVKSQNISFPIGMIEADEKDTRLAWGVKSLPWLILTNLKHIVTSEGFSIT